LSFANIPIGIINTKGYIAIRWYQQRLHGVKPKTSLKIKLPEVAAIATSQAMYKMLLSKKFFKFMVFTVVILT
jgi:hypothetical protein